MLCARWLGLLALTLIAACGSRRTVVVTREPPREVEIEVEVYDPVSNGVWEGVSVRVVEGYHEWSGRTCTSGNPDLWLVTDRSGRVLFTPDLLADADIGFLEDADRRAIIESDRHADEAYVLIEVDAVGFDRQQFDIPLSWRVPSVLASVPFEEPAGAGTLGDGPLPAEQRSEPSPQRLAARVVAPRARHPALVEQDRVGQ